MNDTISTTADVVVVGLGIHGSAAAYALAERGLSVIGIEQFEPAHTRGSSHGATRMIRRAYPSPVWNPLVDRAFAAWRRWEEASGLTLVRTTGGLYAHREPGKLQGPECEVVGSDRFAELMPSLTLPEDYSAVYDPSAGVIEAADALAFAQSQAASLGAELRFGETLLRWTATNGGVLVDTDRGTIHAGKLVLALGPWVGTAVPELAAFFEVWRIVTVATPAGLPSTAPPDLGTFSIDLPEGLVFGLPDVAGHGLKLGIDAGPVVDPDVPLPPPTEAEIERLRTLLARLVPSADLTTLDAVACLYTMTPDRRFVLGGLPWSPDVVVAAACSGHGFKFGPAIGDAVADLCQGVDRPDLDFLAVARFVPEKELR